MHLSLSTKYFYMSLFFAVVFFFFNDTATTEIYTLSLHDALPIWRRGVRVREEAAVLARDPDEDARTDRKSTRLNSSHDDISYAVFCLKKTRQSANSVGACSRTMSSTFSSVSSVALH